MNLCKYCLTCCWPVDTSNQPHKLYPLQQKDYQRPSRQQQLWREPVVCLQVHGRREHRRGQVL